MRASAAEFSMNGDQFLGREYKNNDFDCQDFVEHVMKTVGITDNLPGSNAWYRKMTWVGTPEECIKKFGSVPAGALLFILEQNGKEPEKYKADGIGNASHIGIKTGRTQNQMLRHAQETGVANAGAYGFGSGAIHSSASRGHVVTSSFSDKSIRGGWNRVGLWDRFDYGDKINALLGGGKEEVTIVLEYAFVTGGNLNLRASTSTTAPKITTIPNGSRVTIIEKTNDTWWKVTYGADTGYVKKEFLKAEEETGGTGVITLPKETALIMYEALKTALGK